MNIYTLGNLKYFNDNKLNIINGILIKHHIEEYSSLFLVINNVPKIPTIEDK